MVGAERICSFLDKSLERSDASLALVWRVDRAIQADGVARGCHVLSTEVRLAVQSTSTRALELEGNLSAWLRGGEDPSQSRPVKVD